MPNFWQRILILIKTIKIGPRDFIFPIKQEDICDYTTRCFISSGLMLYDIIMNLFSDITEQKKNSSETDLFGKIYLCQGSRQDYSRKTLWYQKDITYTSFHWKERLWKHLWGLFSIVIDEANMETEQISWSMILETLITNI